MNQRKQSPRVWLSKFKLFRMFKDKNVNYINMDKINKYEEDFAKIQAATEIKDFEKLIQIFVKNEENVYLFKLRILQCLNM